VPGLAVHHVGVAVGLGGAVVSAYLVVVGGVERIDAFALEDDFLCAPGDEQRLQALLVLSVLALFAFCLICLPKMYNKYVRYFFAGDGNKRESNMIQLSQVDESEGVRRSQMELEVK
jgi:hypothetical protein